MATPHQDRTDATAGAAAPASGVWSRRMWRWTGLALLGLGGIGMFLPLLPTTIFWILAAVCFGKGDPRLQAWIYGHPRFGRAVETFVSRGAMSRRGKLYAVAGLGTGCILAVAVTPVPEVRVAMLAVFLSVTIYIVTRPET